MPSFTTGQYFFDGQLTPPSSPDRLRAVAKHGTRLQLSRLLKKSKSAKSNRIVSVHQLRAAPMLLDAAEIEVPHLPTYTESAICSEKTYGVSKMPTPPPELRRVSTSYRDLRYIASLQSNIKKTSPDTSPLLPSPLADSRTDKSVPYIPFRNPRTADLEKVYNSYDDHHILSCYYENNMTQDLDNTAAKDEHSQISVETFLDVNADDDSSASEIMPETPKDRCSRDTDHSPESGWLANTMSHAERLRRFKSRCYQVVQHPLNPANTREGSDGIMLATLLIGPGKPRLVQISRPPSNSSSGNILSPENDQCQPETPAFQHNQVSAFSPFDTPCRKTPSSRGNMSDSKNHRSQTPSHSPSFRPPSQRLRYSASTIFSNTVNRLQHLADPFNISPRTSSLQQPQRSIPSMAQSTAWMIRKSPALSTSSDQNLLPPQQLPTPQPASTMSHKQSTTLTKILNAVSQAINSFPDSVLHLSSTIVLNIRSPYVLDVTYMTTLNKIFPDANNSLLSALAAWILIDLYLSKIGMFNSAEKQETTDNGSYSSSSTSTMTTSPDSAVNEMYYSQVTTSDDSVYRIPNKARYMLGIGVADSTAISSNEAALRKRAVAIMPGVGSIARKLIEALREGVWDEDIWRALRVLVGVIEGGSKGWV